MDNKACMLMLFYSLLVLVLILKNKQILKTSRNNMMIIGLSLSLLLIAPLINKNNIYESFDETTMSQPSYVQNISHKDDMLEKINMLTSNVVCYFSTFQIDSFEPNIGTFHNLKNTTNEKYIKLILSQDNANPLTELVDQRNGIRLHDYTQIEGYPCNELNLNGMREFSIFWFIKFDFTVNDYSTDGKLYNLIELYSSNITGLKALAIHLELKKGDNETFETFKINYAGLEYQYIFNNEARLSNRVDFNKGTHLLTFVKYMEDNVHYIKMTTDDERFLLNPVRIEMSEIRFIGGSVNNGITLSSEKFMMNKWKEGSQQNPTIYSSLKLYIYSFGIFKKAIHTTTQSSTIISNINSNLRQQRDIELSNIFLTTQHELYHRTSEADEYLEKKSCKLSSSVCQECDGVDWSDLASIVSSSQCLESVKDYCKNIQNGDITDFTDYQKSICDALFPNSEEHILSNVSSNILLHTCSNIFDDNKTDRVFFKGLRTVVPNNIERNTYHVRSNEILPSEYAQGDVIQKISTTNLLSSVPTFNNVANDILSRPIGNISYDELVRIAEAVKNNTDPVSSTSSSTSTSTSTSTSSANKVVVDPGTEPTITHASTSDYKDLTSSQKYDNIMKEFNIVNEEMDEIDTKATESSMSFIDSIKKLFGFI